MQSCFIGATVKSFGFFATRVILSSGWSSWIELWAHGESSS